MSDHATAHEIRVDAWLEASAAKGLPRAVILDLFEAALVALWARTRTVLGQVTLTAIADRVLHTAIEAYPGFAPLKVEPNGRIQGRELRRTGHALHRQMLLAGIRFVLVEFLTVLGNLTAELLTPELHDVLSNVAADPAAGRFIRSTAVSGTRPRQRIGSAAADRTAPRGIAAPRSWQLLNLN